MERNPAYAPRIYFIHPAWVGPLHAWHTLFERAAALGFDHILIASPFLPSRSGNPWLPATHSQAHPSFETDAPALDVVRQLAAAAAAQKLALLVDVALDRVAREHPFHAEHPDWFHPLEADDARLDPRHSGADIEVAQANFDNPETTDRLIEIWARHLLAMADAGVAGFRFENPHRAPAHVSRRLAAAVRERHPDTRFLAWTPGLARADLPGLANAGFNAVFSSVRWWDYRSSWLTEEHAALIGIAAPIAFPEAPLGTPLLHDLPGAPDPGSAALGYRRALQTAAALGTGLLVPLGFEFGVAQALGAGAAVGTGWEALRAAARFDLSPELARVNQWLQQAPVLASVGALVPLSGPNTPVLALLRTSGFDARRADDGLLVLVNASLQQPAEVRAATFLDGVPGCFTQFQPFVEATGKPGALPELTLLPGEVRWYRATHGKPILAIPATRKIGKAADRKTVNDALSMPRIAIEHVTPAVEAGRFAAKRVVGEWVNVEADIFADGHDHLAAAVLWRPADATEWRQAPMTELGNDRWRARFPLNRLGPHEFMVQAWRDDYGTLVDHLNKKLQAGQKVDLEIQEGHALLARTLEYATQAALPLNTIFKKFAKADAGGQLTLLLDPATAQAAAATQYRPFLVEHPLTLRVDAERRAARFASWYEVFPRSMSDDLTRHGTFIDVIGKLPRIRDMGFDVLYFPPIHPIGKQNRKGRNNTLVADETDVGSPYAIGGPDGGHEAIHAELGSFDDFKQLLDAARDHGIEIALDFAIQCSPDHPWLAEHPDWFAWRPDGTLRYAENPPKKYQDIVNPDFYAAQAKPALWLALRDAVLFWVKTGVKIFRVDNPHTKPLPFWEWLIGEVRGRHPEVIFLAEAFTRPRVMNRLAKLGFSQSYTYFTWRESKQDFIDYLTELTTSGPQDYFRPNFFVNTPDINPRFLQGSGRAGFVIRAALAATLSGLWGVYNGFELCVATALPNAAGGPSEEYLDSEKYQLRAWDWQQPGNIVAEITALNRIRRANPALHTHLGLTFLGAQNDQILFFEKATENRDNVVLVAINLDPFHAQSASVELPLWRWRLDDGATLAATDLITGDRFEWHGKSQHIALDPGSRPFSIWGVQPVIQATS